jgi:putative heme degradation protein
MIDLNSAEIQAVHALNRLREPGNEALGRLLASELEVAKQKLVHAGDTVTIHRLQGRAEAFEDLLRAIEESAKVANRA